MTRAGECDTSDVTFRWSSGTDFPPPRPPLLPRSLPRLLLPLFPSFSFLVSTLSEASIEPETSLSLALAACRPDQPASLTNGGSGPSRNIFLISSIFSVAKKGARRVENESGHGSVEEADLDPSPGTLSRASAGTSVSSAVSVPSFTEGAPRGASALTPDVGSATFFGFFSIGAGIPRDLM